MHKRNYLIVIPVILLFFLSLLGCSKKLKPREDITVEPPETTAVAQDNAVPYVEFKDGDGNTVHISSFIDKPFFLYESEIGEETFEDTIEIINESAKSNSSYCQYIVVFACSDELPVSSDEVLSTDRAFLTVLYDPNKEAAQKLNGGLIPFALFVDQDGFISTRCIGSPDKNELDFGISLIKNKEA